MNGQVSSFTSESNQEQEDVRHLHCLKTYWIQNPHRALPSRTCYPHDGDAFSEGTSGRRPSQVIQEADFVPWPLTQCGLLGGSLLPGGGPAVALGPAHKQVPQVILPRLRNRRDREGASEVGATGKRVADGEQGLPLGGGSGVQSRCEFSPS